MLKYDLQRGFFFFSLIFTKKAIFFLRKANSSGYLLRKSNFDLKHFEGDVIELIQKTNK